MKKGKPFILLFLILGVLFIYLGIRNFFSDLPNETVRAQQNDPTPTPTTGAGCAQLGGSCYYGQLCPPGTTNAGAQDCNPAEGAGPINAGRCCVPVRGEIVFPTAITPTPTPTLDKSEGIINPEEAPGPRRYACINGECRVVFRGSVRCRTGRCYNTLPACEANCVQDDSKSPNCPQKPQGDANCDARVNLTDFEIWRKEFHQELDSKKADFNGDGAVDLSDFQIWRSNVQLGE